MSEAATSEISAANYRARALGVRAGMRLGVARRLCPPDHPDQPHTLVVLPYDFQAYAATSEQIYRVLYKYTNNVECKSLRDTSEVLYVPAPSDFCF